MSSNIRDLIDGVGNRLAIHHSYQSIFTLRFTGITVDPADLFKFDIGQRGKAANYTADAVITDAPQGLVQFTVPAGAFDSPREKLVFQVRYTPNGGQESIIFDAFMDVVDNITPNP